jgi:amino acid transporter
VLKLEHLTDSHASRFPTAAGQFQWVYECAPARYHRVLAFCTGWLCSFAWPTFAASCAVITGNTVRDCVLLYHPEAPIIGHAIVPGWFSTLVAWLSLLLAYLFNTTMAKWLAWVEKIVLVVHICHAVAVVVVLWCLSPIATPRDALLTFNNGGDVSSLENAEREKVEERTENYVRPNIFF